MKKGIRSALVVVLVALVGVSGCSCCGDKTQTGVTFAVTRPTVVSQELAMLYGGTLQSAANGQAMGSTLGPVSGGAMQLANTMPNVSMAPPYIPPPPAIQAAPCAPAANLLPMPQREPDVAKLTCEQWCELMRKVQAQRMPKGD